MKENIMKYINQLEGFKTAIKNQHWASANMSMHKLFDDIADSVSDIQDTVSEECQGIHGRINKNELKPISYTINGEQKFLDDMLKASNEFYDSIKEGDEYIGVRSEMETFIGEISKFKYLMDLCIKESFKRDLRKQIMEKQNINMKNTIRLTENDVKNIVMSSVNTILKEYYDGPEADRYDSFDSKLDELDEINQTLTQDEDLDYLIQEMRQIINKKRMR